MKRSYQLSGVGAHEPVHKRLTPRWQLPLLLSLLLHAGVFSCCYFWRGTGANTAPADIDTRAGSGRMEVTLTLLESTPKRSLPAVSRTPQRTNPVEPPAGASANPAVPPAARTAAIAEEQEDGVHGAAGSGDARDTNPPASEGTSFFAIPTQARRIVYVIDHSASMGLNGSLERAKRELAASLEKLPETAFFQVVIYNRRAEVLALDSSSDLAPATSQARRRACQLLTDLLAEGGTDYVPALKRALALRPEVVFFLTDGDGLRLPQIQAITQLNRGRATIHAIELGNKARASAESSLQILARANRGTYCFVPLER